MTTVFYTHDFQGLDSSLVYDVWYDEKIQAAYVNLNDEVYLYDEVPLAEVQSLVDAYSIGRAFNGGWMKNGFKQKYGPGTRIGHAGHLRYEKRELAVAESNTGHLVSAAPGIVPKNLTYSEGVKVTEGNSNPSEVRVSLQAKHVASGEHENAVADLSARLDAQKAKGKYTVHFESNGSRTYTLDASSVDEAVEELQRVASMLGVNATVTGVFVHLG